MIGWLLCLVGCHDWKYHWKRKYLWMQMPMRECRRGHCDVVQYKLGKLGKEKWIDFIRSVKED